MKRILIIGMLLPAISFASYSDVEMREFAAECRAKLVEANVDLDGVTFNNPYTIRQAQAEQKAMNVVGKSKFSIANCKQMPGEPLVLKIEPNARRVGEAKPSQATPGQPAAPAPAAASPVEVLGKVLKW